MSSKLDIQKLTYDLGLKPFRFTLSEASEGVKVLYHSPDGWADAETTYTRHKTYHSVLRSASTKELTFYKEGMLFLKNCYENSGIDCNATMAVEKLNKTTQTYESYPAAGKFDFSTYQVNEVSVKIQMIDTSFKEKVINRATTEVDILKRTSIEGFEVAAFTVDEVTFPDTSVNFTSSYVETVTPPATKDETTSPHVVPMLLLASTFAGSQSQTPAQTPLATTGAFFFEATQARVITVTGTTVGQQFGSGTVNFYLIVFNSSGDEILSTLLKHYPGANSAINFDYNEVVTLASGDSIMMRCVFGGTKIEYISIDHEVDEVYTGTPEITVTAYPYYEAYLRTCQLISDLDNPFKSDFFGRTDTPLTTYGSDGDGSLGFVTKGLYLRKESDTNPTIPVKLQELFETHNDIFRLGLGVESSKVVVEEIDYFFNDTVVLDISDQLREEDIEKHVMPEMFYKSVEFGYSKAEYDNNAGLFEFNTKNSWTTIIKSVFNDLKKIVKYRADGQGIRLELLAPYSVDDDGDSDYDPTKDVKGDSDIFLIDALRDGATDFIVRTNQGFDYIGGSVYAASSFNVWYSPARCLRRWGANVKAGLTKALNSYLRWVASEKNTTLESRLSTETLTVVENADICVDDLNANRWLNEKYIVSAPLTTAQLNAFDASPNGLVKLSDTKYGWVLSLKTKNKDGMSEIELLRYNADEVIPT